MDRTRAEQSASAFWTSRSFALLLLVAANLAVIVFFVFYGGSILQALWIYWLQSVIIGAVNVVRILGQKNISFENIKIEGMGAGALPLDKLQTKKAQDMIRIFFAAFFSLHYGGFHLVYMVFLIAFSSHVPFTFNGAETGVSLGSASAAAVLLSGLGFAIHHVLSYLEERRDIAGQPQPVVKVWAIMFRPYARILPLHLIIIFGPIAAIAFGNAWVFVAFMVLKTIADIALYQSGLGHPQSKILAAANHSA